MYIDMCQILKRYIHAERSGDWQSHLDEIEKMLPYIVSAGHQNYASCLPMYLRDVRELPNKHPDVHHLFMQDNFTVHRSSGSFNGIWTDLALEQTFNREGKTTLLRGISQKKTAKEKYIKSVPFLTKVSESVRKMARIDQNPSTHHGESQKKAL